MGKIGFKADGTVFAIYAKKFEGEMNPFAGAIYYSFSSDKGKDWSEPQYLHTDTAHHYGRSFFDITRMQNGELGVIWLDGRFGKSIKGSSLFFASTQKGAGFTNERCIAKGTCECCRTEIQTDERGNIHIAYRNIFLSNALMGEQVRDMVYSVSQDNGVSFSKPEMISKDNWKIDGCPHSGPTLAVNGAAVNAVWFTSGGTAGLYHTSKPNLNTAFSLRTLLSAAGRHPQSAAAGSGKIAVVYEESSGTEHGMSNKPEGPHKHMSGHHSKPGNAKLMLSILGKKGELETRPVTDGKYSDHHAVLNSVDDYLLAAWVREENGKSKICYSLIGLK
jgi:hypothetical protein